MIENISIVTHTSKLNVKQVFYSQLVMAVFRREP